MSGPSLPDRLRTALKSAMKERDAVAVSALRSALSAIDNASAVDPGRDHSVTAPTAGPIAGATTGLGAGEAPRRQLSDEEMRALVQCEQDERLTAATEYEGAGRTEEAARLRAEAAVLLAHLPATPAS